MQTGISYSAMATRPRLSVRRKPRPKTGNRSSLSINLLSLIYPSTIAHELSDLQKLLRIILSTLLQVDENNLTLQRRQHLVSE